MKTNARQEPDYRRSANRPPPLNIDPNSHSEWLLDKDWLSFEHRISSTSQGERLPSQAYHRQSKERTGRKRANQILSLLSPS